MSRRHLASAASTRVTRRRIAWALPVARWTLPALRPVALLLIAVVGWFLLVSRVGTEEAWLLFALVWIVAGLFWLLYQLRLRSLHCLQAYAEPLDAPLLAEFWSRVPPRDEELRSVIEAVLPSLVECEPDCLEGCPQHPPARVIDPRFIEHCKAARQGGEVLPPWIRSPGYPPWSVAWRQGNGEAWMNETWRPFWRSLDDAAQREYAARWEADEEWREYLFEIWKR